MKTRLLCAVALVIVLAVPSIARANLLINPGFEDDMQAWGFFGPAGSSSQIVTGGAYSENKYGQATHVQSGGEAWGGFYQGIYSATPGETIYISGAVKAEAIEGAATGKIQLEYCSDLYAQKALDPSTFLKTDYVDSVGEGWCYLSASGTIPPDAKSMKLVTLTTAYGGTTATFGFDELWTDYQPIPEPSTLLLLSSGLVGLMGFVKRKRS